MYAKEFEIIHNKLINKLINKPTHTHKKQSITILITRSVPLHHPQFDRQSSIRYSSRRARTLESLASLYEVSRVSIAKPKTEIAKPHTKHLLAPIRTTTWWRPSRRAPCCSASTTSTSTWWWWTMTSTWRSAKWSRHWRRSATSTSGCPSTGYTEWKPGLHSIYIYIWYIRALLHIRQ